VKISIDQISKFEGELLEEGFAKYGRYSTREDLLPLIQKVVDWSLEEVEKMFNHEERLGAKGYAPNVPAKMVKIMRVPAKTYRDVLLEDLENLYESIQTKDNGVKGNYKRLRETLENFPVSSLIQ
jgi:hypothetical protein